MAAPAGLIEVALGGVVVRVSAFKRVALPEELHDARPKRLRFVLLNGFGKVVRHARETLLRLVGERRRQLADRACLALATGPPLVTTA